MGGWLLGCLLKKERLRHLAAHTHQKVVSGRLAFSHISRTHAHTHAHTRTRWSLAGRPSPIYHARTRERTHAPVGGLWQAGLLPYITHAIGSRQLPGLAKAEVGAGVQQLQYIRQRGSQYIRQ